MDAKFSGRSVKAVFFLLLMTGAVIGVSSSLTGCDYVPGDSASEQTANNSVNPNDPGDPNNPGDPNDPGDNGDGGTLPAGCEHISYEDDPEAQTSLNNISSKDVVILNRGGYLRSVKAESSLQIDARKYGISLAVGGYLVLRVYSQNEYVKNGCSTYGLDHISVFANWNAGAQKVSIDLNKVLSSEGKYCFTGGSITDYGTRVFINGLTNEIFYLEPRGFHTYCSDTQDYLVLSYIFVRLDEKGQVVNLRSELTESIGVLPSDKEYVVRYFPLTNVPVDDLKFDYNQANVALENGVLNQSLRLLIGGTVKKAKSGVEAVNSYESYEFDMSEVGPDKVLYVELQGRTYIPVRDEFNNDPILEKGKNYSIMVKHDRCVGWTEDCFSALFKYVSDVTNIFPPEINAPR
jgi:hypothetical protein